MYKPFSYRISELLSPRSGKMFQYIRFFLVEIYIILKNRRAQRGKIFNIHYIYQSFSSTISYQKSPGKVCVENILTYGQNWKAEPKSEASDAFGGRKMIPEVPHELAFADRSFHTQRQSNVKSIHVHNIEDVIYNNTVIIWF